MNTDLRRLGKFLTHNFEAIVWIAVIMVFALSPLPYGEHFSICPLSVAGFEHCPGCGLGRAMILLLHGKVSESISMHPLAIPALALFTVRIVIVFKNYYNFHNKISPKTN